MSYPGSLSESREKEEPQGANAISHPAIARNIDEDEPFLDEIKAINSEDELEDLSEAKKNLIGHKS